MLSFVRHITAKVPSHNTMPLLLKSLEVSIINILWMGDLFDICCNVLLNVVLLHGLRGTIHCILLHVLRHISVLYYCLPVSHDGCEYEEKRQRGFTDRLVYSHMNNEEP
uniref:Uncharacterized protein n=1 Tax=Sinocyclocheilus anshuiensis TaxID=1608454 RepID=A0A671LKT8_9TELE